MKTISSATCLSNQYQQIISTTLHIYIYIYIRICICICICICVCICICICICMCMCICICMNVYPHMRVFQRIQRIFQRIQNVCFSTSINTLRPDTKFPQTEKHVHLQLSIMSECLHGVTTFLLSCHPPAPKPILASELPRFCSKFKTRSGRLKRGCQ